MTWRPDGWDDTRNKILSDRFACYCRDCASVDDIAEAGADAILEALFELARKSPTKTFIIDSRVTSIEELE